MISNMLKPSPNIDSWLFKLALGQKIIEERIKQTLNIYNAGVNKISNKTKKSTRIGLRKLCCKKITK